MQKIIPEDIRCLVIGANGLVGGRIREILSNHGLRWAGTCRARPEEGLLRSDITSADDLKRLFSLYKPDCVFHCANLSGGVDFCESRRDMAVDFHLNAAKEIVRHCADTGAKLIFLSTDYIFDGTKGPYSEDDEPHPLNAYGELKLEAEEHIRANLERHIIVRTTNVYGWDAKTVTPNYMMSLYRALTAHKAFNAPSFLWGNPTYAGDLADAVFELYRKEASGVFHVVGSDFVNRYEWARTACDVFGLDSSFLREIKEPSPDMVPRPLKSWLRADKFNGLYDTKMHNLRAGLELMRSDIKRP